MNILTNNNKIITYVSINNNLIEVMKTKSEIKLSLP